MWLYNYFVAFDIKSKLSKTEGNADICTYTKGKRYNQEDNFVLDYVHVL